MSIETTSPGDPGYPSGLLDLEDPPSLFVRGELGVLPGVAVVGTRRCTGYGTVLSEAFGASISRAGWSTVSGLARGIDAAAHRGCVAAGGHALAVLGCGVDVCYPESNRPLFERLVEVGGAILSEYPPGTPPDRWRFPARNRIIAAISRAVVVVEAWVTGGALITARIGAEIGRPVFVVPGDVDRPSSEGCNRLIKDGAHPVLGAEDLIAELELVLGPAMGVQDEASELPSTGIDVEELSQLWGIDIAATLSRIGSMELEGKARLQGRRVYPR